MDLLIPCILLLVISGAVSDSKVVNGTLGRFVNFYESFTDPTLILQWNFKSTVLVASRYTGYPPECSPEYAGRCQLYDNGTLRLDNLTADDEGPYSFTVRRPPSTPVSGAVYELRVYPILDSPVLTSNDTSDKLIGGSYVSLHCNAGGQTVEAYTFYRDGKNICLEPRVACRNSYLYFHLIAQSDSGSYTCTIQNPVSSNTSNTLQLTVSDPVSDVNIISNRTGLVWPGLDSVSLTCSAHGTDVTYSWSLQGESLLQDNRYHLTENNTVLTISPITSNDNGNFTCTASNWINNQTSNRISFNLASNVSAVTLTGNTSASYIWAGEDSVSLHCSADGSNVTFIWRLNGEPLPEDSQYHISNGDSPPHSNLLISPVSKKDAGPFTCEAYNRLNRENSKALRLNLAWNPEEDIACSAVSEGQGIKLGCSWPGGHPEANLTLTFNGKTENGTNMVTSLVTIGDVQGKDLTCLGEQLGRKSQCTVSMVPPKAPRHDNDTITETMVGETLYLTVILEPGLPAIFTWVPPLSSQSKESIQSQKSSVNSTNFSSSYLIRDVTVNDAGKYECIAKNIIGTKSFLFTVSVTKPPTPVGLSGGAIAGIVIGVFAGVALTGTSTYFIVKKKKRSGDNKRINEPDDQLGPTVTYATVQKNKGGVAETSLTNNQQEDDVKYAELKFPNNKSTMATVPPPVETEYSTVKTSIKQ